MPICLLIDGQFYVKDLEKSYGVRAIDRTLVSEVVLRKRSFGWGQTKMIAFGESPWSIFLRLDADE